MIYKVLRIDEQMYGCEELPADQPLLCDVVLKSPDGVHRVLPYPDAELRALGIEEGTAVMLDADGTMKKM